MKSFLSFLFFIASLFILSCKPEATVVLPSLSGPDTLWTSPIPGLSNYISQSVFAPAMAGNKLVILNGFRNKFYFFDRFSGADLQVFEGFGFYALNFGSWRRGLSSGNQLIGADEREIKRLDLNSGNVNLVCDLDFYRDRSIIVLGSNIYFNAFDSETRIVSLLKTNEKSLNKVDTVFSAARQDFKEIRISGPVLAMHGSDSLIIFQTSPFSSLPVQGYVDVYAYNLRTKKIQWHVDHSKLEGNSLTGVCTPTKTNAFYWASIIFTVLVLPMASCFGKNQHQC